MKSFHIRGRTLLVPASVILFYLFSQNLVSVIFFLVFPIDSSVPEGTPSAVYNRHQGSYSVMFSLFVLAVVLAAYVWRRRSGRSLLLPVLRLRRPDKHFDGYTPVIAMGMYCLAQIYFSATLRLADSNPGISDSIADYKNKIQTDVVGHELILYLLAVGILVPILEEVLFRGMIMGELLAAMRPAAAVFLSSALFGLMHGQPVQIGYAVICGVFLGVTYYLSDSLVTPILVHIFFNLVGGVLLEMPESISGKFSFLYEQTLLLVMLPLMFVALTAMRRTQAERKRKEAEHEPVA